MRRGWDGGKAQGATQKDAVEDDIGLQSRNCLSLQVPCCNFCFPQELVGWQHPRRQFTLSFSILVWTIAFCMSYCHKVLLDQDSKHSTVHWAPNRYYVHDTKISTRAVGGIFCDACCSRRIVISDQWCGTDFQHKMNSYAIFACVVWFCWIFT